MATETDNHSTAAAEDKPSKTLDTAVPDSTKTDRGEDSTETALFTVDLAIEGPKKDSENSKSTAPVTDIEKKIRRAERFGITVQLSEQEKRNTRAERFGTGTGTGTGSTAQGSESDSVKKSEELKRKARAERFGIPVPPVARRRQKEGQGSQVLTKFIWLSIYKWARGILSQRRLLQVRLVEGLEEISLLLALRLAVEVVFLGFRGIDNAFEWSLFLKSSKSIRSSEF
ncbi:hypothetical protein OIU78_019622 [Salix suchowensis]|nr:hypothetical protein OIU78_019622 [Salix suchowensis]